MKTSGRAYRVAIFSVALLVAWCCSPAWAAPGPPGALKVNAVVDAHGVRLEAHAADAFDYTTYRPSENLFIVDLTGVTLERSENAKVLDSALVSSYRLLQYRAGDRPIVRLEILLRVATEPQMVRTGTNDLTITIGTPATSGTVSQTETPAPQKESQLAKTETSSGSKPSVGPGPATIQSVGVDAQDQQVRVHIEADNHLKYEVLRLTKPDRLVLDFAGARLRLAKRAITAKLDPVQGIRASQFKPELARVVIDLTRGVTYSISAEGNALTVSFGAPENKPAGETQVGTTQIVKAVPEVPPQTQTQTQTQTETTNLTETAPVKVGETKTESSTDANTGNPPTKVNPPETLVPQNVTLARPSTPKAETPKIEAKVETTTTSAPVAPSTAPVMPQNPPAGGKPSGGKYSGEPISVNLKDVDLKDFFRLIHEISGLNVVLDPAVRGTLTIVLDDVPWDQALDLVLQNNNLDKQLEGNVLRVATRDTLKKEAETKRDLAKAEAEAVGQVTATRVLSYAKATAIRDTLKRFLSARGDILADDRSNTLIIRDIPSVLPEVDALIKQLDRKSQQVEIEARVVSASRTFSLEIGTQFGISAAATSGRNIFGGLPGNTNFVSPIIRGPGLPPPPLVSATSTAMPLMTDLRAVSPTSGFSFAHSSPNFALDFIISAAEAKGVGKLLSKPKVITQNNEKATVKQGSKIPVQTVINNTISTQFIDAVLKLEVTPQITADGTVYMEVTVENTAIDNGVPRVQGIPALTTQSAETKVLVSDGGTVVIGGVIISQQRTDIAQVPLLGSIPVIGHLFKHATISTQSQELLFFLTPRIVPT